MKKYPEYKDSGIEWLGEIPEHWELRRLATIGRFSKGKGISRDEIISEGFPCIRYGEIYTEYERIVVNPVSRISEESNEKSEKIRKRDVLFTASGETLEEIGKTIVYDGDEDIYVGGDIVILKLKSDISHIYLSFALNCNFVNQQKTKLGKDGIIVHIYPKQLRNILIALPSCNEQTTIANFLDLKTQQIDDLIERKKRLIELLKEERTAVINQAVTKGLDPNVPMKDSGIEWMGEIPEHWAEVKLKRVSDKITDGEHISPNFIADGVPFLSAKDVRDRDLNFNVDKFVSYQDAEAMRKRCAPENGDLLIVSRGATIGRIGLVDTDKLFCLLGSVILVKPNNKVLVKYLYYLLSSSIVLEEFLLTSQSSAQQAIYIIDVAELKIPLPSIDEQRELIDYLELRNHTFHSHLNVLNNEIELLYEFRNSLINEAVTGKIDVRDYQISHATK